MSEAAMASKPEILRGISLPPEITICAEEMANALSIVAHKLNHWNLINQEGFSVLLSEVARLQRQRTATSWGIDIDRETPVVFAQAEDKNGNAIYPRLVCAGITVKQDQHDRPPFSALDIAIEVNNPDRLPIARWHVDLANAKETEMQPGPLIHLQYGGHVHGHRELDHPLKEPRWCHPPMEIVLLCEVIVANFYPDYWELLREDMNWCQAISVGQKLCYSAYLRKMLTGFSVSSKTLLHSMWASDWALSS